MIPLPGFIYFDPNFNFKDGPTGPKLFIVLCASPLDSDLVLVARTTSKPKTDPTYGCHFPSRYEAIFFIPLGSCVLTDNTWVKFDYLNEYESKILKRWKRIGDLTLQQTKDMLLCGAQSYTMPKWQRESIDELGNLIKP